MTPKAKGAVDKSKDAVCSVPVLSNPDMSKDFIMYIFFRSV